MKTASLQAPLPVPGEENTRRVRAHTALSHEPLALPTALFRVSPQRLPCLLFQRLPLHRLLAALAFVLLASGCAALRPQTPANSASGANAAAANTVATVSIPGTEIVGGNRAIIRSGEALKAYPVNRYVDPLDPDVMHEGHVVYRKENAASWNLLAPDSALPNEHGFPPDDPGEPFDEPDLPVGDGNLLPPLDTGPRSGTRSGNRSGTRMKSASGAYSESGVEPRTGAHSPLFDALAEENDMLSEENTQLKQELARLRPESSPASAPTPPPQSRSHLLETVPAPPPEGNPSPSPTPPLPSSASPASPAPPASGPVPVSVPGSSVASGTPPVASASASPMVAAIPIAVPPAATPVVASARAVPAKAVSLPADVPAATADFLPELAPPRLPMPSSHVGKPGPASGSAQPLPKSTPSVPPVASTPPTKSVPAATPAPATALISTKPASAPASVAPALLPPMKLALAAAPRPLLAEPQISLAVPFNYVPIWGSVQSGSLSSANGMPAVSSPASSPATSPSASGSA